MDKETLSNYGWIVICVLVLAVMLALAAPFGTFIADGFKATYTGLFDTGDSALDVGLSAVGVTNALECGHGRKESGDHSQLGCGHFACEDCGCVPASCGIEGHWSGDGKDHSTVNHSDHTYACECSGWVVPEGGTYTCKDGTIYGAEETLACGYKSQYGDIYEDEWYSYSVSSTWSVDTKDKTLVEYGPLMTTINGKNVASLGFTFKDCVNMKKAPAIPETITNMYGTFEGCTQLVDLSNVVIPEGVTTLQQTFKYCSSIVEAPVIHDKITYLWQTFEYCTSLKTVSAIPSSVDKMQYAFDGCTSLTGIITLNAEPAEGYYSSCFRNVDFKTQNITFVGTASLMDSIGATGKNYCAECNGTCQNNH